jgi:hypothetical protein
VNIDFEDADDPSAPSDGADVIGRSLTGNTVAWDPDASWSFLSTYDTPSLITPLQAVIDRLGWSSGQAVICNIIDNNSAAGDGHGASTRDYNTSYSAELRVEWTT